MEKIRGQPILIWVKNRISKNKNVIAVCNGSTGSGKTYAMITLALQLSEMFGTSFNVHDNMDFNFASLLKKMDLPQHRKKGTVFLFEEVGAVFGGASARDWQSQTNKFFHSFMQTSRHRNHILLMTCPMFSNLELGTRQLVHMQFEMDRINFEKKISYLKPYRIQVNSRTRQFYFKYLRVRQDGKRFSFVSLSLPCPPGDVMKEYEILKTKYTDQLNRMIIEGDKSTKKKRDKINPDVIKKLLDKGLKHKEIADLFDISTKSVQRYKGGQDLP